MRPLGEYLKVRTEQLGGASLVGSSVWVDWGLHNQVDGKHWFQGHLRGYNKQTGEFKVTDFRLCVWLEACHIYAAVSDVYAKLL